MPFINVQKKFMGVNNIKIEIAYAAPQQQTILQLVLPSASTIRDAIVCAKLFGENIDALPVGIYGKIRTLNTILQDGDRVEIYRPLLNDPKDARKQRVRRDRKQKRIAKNAKFVG